MSGCSSEFRNEFTVCSARRIRAVISRGGEIVGGRMKRTTGIPTGNAGEYFVMGELLRQGLDAQLADRNTKGYDLLVGREGESSLRKVQVKTARHRSWWVNRLDFEGARLKQSTVYVLMHANGDPVRYFIVQNARVKDRANWPHGWKHYGFVRLAAIEKYENRWSELVK